jgi:hypothetical protein
MKRKSIKIDWDELESAFNNRNRELVYYLDRVTGQVVLEGEGEDDFDDDEEMIDDLSAQEAPQRTDSTRLYIEPPDTDELIAWMFDFLEEFADLDPDIRARLTEAVEEPEPVTAVRQILAENPEVRDRWYGYRGTRTHENIEAWLDANGVTAVDPPPWK